MAGSLLVVEDNRDLREGLAELLRQEGYTAAVADTARGADRLVRERAYDLILLDIGLPDGNGIGLCENWRQAGVSCPILFLTASDEEISIVRGLDAGGDDYVTKPFRLRELLSRVKALLRRSAPATYQDEGLRIDFPRRTVTLDKQPLFLTPTEYQLLQALVQSRGCVLTREALLANLWDEAGEYIDDNTLSVHISRLREKIGARRIRTVRGVGYAWEEA